MSLKIGNIDIDPPLILAPMAGITDLPFRLTVKRKGGCGLVYSEMVSANALVRNHKKTFTLLDSHPEEQPLAIQIFGADPEVMAEAGRIVEEMGADILDINLGCPVKKVVKTGAGCALMHSPARAGEVIGAVRRGVRIPVTAKIRAGWDATSINAVEIACILEDNGVDAVAVHPRTRTQGFSGHADWDVISRVKKKLSVPVIGNGDITGPESAQKMLIQSGCDAVMIGRAARGNPWIFREVALFLQNDRNKGAGGIANDGTRYEKKEARPSNEELHRTILSHLQLLVDRAGVENATQLFKKHAAWYVRGLAGSSNFRKDIFSHNNYDELWESIQLLFEQI